MIEIKGDCFIYFDIDDTLAIWEATPEQLEERGVTVTCPGSLVKIDEDGKEHFSPSWSQLILPHRIHIEQLKKHKLRGHVIVAWSAGGASWAALAIKALGLEQYVDVAMSKPHFYYDDLTPEEFMGKRYYFKDET